MTSRIPGIRAAAYSALWAIQEQKLHAVLDFIDLRAQGRTLTKEERRSRGIQAQGRGGILRTVGQIAVLPVRGVIAHHAGMEMDISGGTSTVALGRALAEAVNSPDISAILLDCDSPGGTVEGVPELAAMIYAARGKKPIEASVNAHCHSAAYWLASQCDRINITPSGEAGDIGVMTVRTDWSKADAQMGVTRTLVKAGKYKGEGRPDFPASDAEIRALAEKVGDVYAAFVADVARGRDVSEDEVMNGMGEGRSLLAQRAVEAGLVDRIETIEATLARLGGAGGRAVGRRVATRVARRVTAASDVVDVVENMPNDEIDECPECGTPMEMQDGASVCPECGYTASASEETEVDASAATAIATPGLVASAERTVVVAASGRRDAGPATQTVAARTMTPTVEPTTMPDNVPTREELLAEARKEAAQRANDISTLCAAHDVPAEQMHKYLASDQTVAQIGLAIAAAKRTERAADPSIRVGQDREAERPFDNLGQQLQAIAAHFGGLPGVPVDKRLYAAAASGGATAGTGADGGFAIQKEFTTELLESTIEGGNLLSQCDSHEVGANADGLEVMYLDETSRATGSRWGGVQVYRGAEADAATAKKPKFGKWEVRLEDIIGLAYVTERLLADAASLSNTFSNAFAAEFQFTAENELVRGTGAGQMAGILGHAATVSVAKETAQLADSIVSENIGKMWKCVHPRSRLKGAWYYNVELEDQLDQLQIGTGTSAQLVYMPPGGLSGKPYGTIKGRPTIPIEYASGAGDVGDFFFADWSMYKVITKGGLQNDESIHVRFTTNERTFRWITRINGAPKLKSSITPFKATDSNLKLSPFVTLAAR